MWFGKWTGRRHRRWANPIRTEGGWGELRPIEQANGDSDAEVDVLVLWTPMTMANTGSEAQMRTGIDLAVAWTNDAYQRSGAEVRLNLVGAEPIDYVEDGDSEIDLGRLSHPSDGFMDEAHDRRDALGARSREPVHGSRQLRWHSQLTRAVQRRPFRCG